VVQAQTATVGNQVYRDGSDTYRGSWAGCIWVPFFFFVGFDLEMKANDTYVDRAMNTIVTTRAGKDLISSLCAGLLTIGSRFGGALDEAATMFSNARDTGLTPRQFVDQSRQQNKLSKCNLPFSFLRQFILLARRKYYYK